MGFSSIIVEGIILIAAVIASSILATAIVERTNMVNDAIKQSMKQQADSIKAKIVIVYATYDESIGLFIVYLKNVGKYPIRAIDKMDIYFGEYGKAELYVYDKDGALSPGEWSYMEISESKISNVLEPGETIKILIYNSTVVNPPYYVKIFTPYGTWDEKEFLNAPR